MRNLKKITALFVAVAMICSLGITVMAADNTITPTFTIKNADGNVITAAKAGETVTVSMSIPAGSYGASVFWLSANKSVTLDNLVKQNGLNGNIVTGDPAIKSSAGVLTVTEGTPVLSVDVTIGEIVPGEADIISIYSASMNTEGDVDEITVKDAKATITVLESFTATGVEKLDGVSYPIGTDVAAALANDVTVTVTGADSKKESGYKATWVCKEENCNLNLPGEHEFVGTVVGPDAAKAATWAGALTAEITVQLEALTDGVIETPAVAITAEKEDSEFNLAALKKVLGDAITLKIAKGDFEDVIEVADEWIAVTDIDTTVAADNADVVVINVPAGTNSKNSIFNVKEGAEIKAGVKVNPAKKDYNDVSYETNASSGLEVSDALEVTVNRTEDEAKADPTATVTITITLYDEDGEVAETYEATENFSEEGSTSETFTLPSLAEMFKKDASDMIGMSIKTEVSYNDASVSYEAAGEGEAEKEAMDIKIEKDTPKSNRKPSGIGSATNKPSAGTPVTPDDNTDTPVTPDDNTDTPVTPDVVTGTFSDVPTTHWAYEAIEALADAGIINGVGDGTFNVDGNVTRAEFAKMIVAATGLEASSTETAFTDCTADDWYTPYVVAAAEAGYVTGITETYFGAEELISRQDICTIIGRAIGVESENAAAFTDADQIADYAVPYVNALVELGVVNGYEDGTFRPEANASRAEAAKIIYGIAAVVVDNNEAVVEDTTDEVVDEVVEDETIEDIESIEG